MEVYWVGHELLVANGDRGLKVIVKISLRRQTLQPASVEAVDSKDEQGEKSNTP